MIKINRDLKKDSDDFFSFSAEKMREKMAENEYGLGGDIEVAIKCCNEAAMNGRISADVVIHSANLTTVQAWLEQRGFNTSTYSEVFPEEYCRINVDWSESDAC